MKDRIFHIVKIKQLVAPTTCIAIYRAAFTCHSFRIPKHPPQDYADAVTIFVATAVPLDANNKLRQAEPFTSFKSINRIYMKSATVSAKNETMQHGFNPQSALISHMPGIIALNLRSPAPCELRSWGRTMALFKEEAQNRYIVDEFHNESNKKKHLKFIRKNSRYLRELFDEQGDIIQYGHNDYKICIPLSDRVYKIVSSEVRSEVYIPIAVLKNKKLQGGAYAYIWRCCSTEQSEKTPTLPVSDAPVRSIVAGMCMFGTNIMGVDQHGRRHPLTNTFYTLPSGARIESIELERDDLHPYEQMMLREFDLQLPMLKALSNGMSQKIFYQCVHAEYILYGVNAYIRGEMTLRALSVYARYVSERAELIRDAIAHSCARHGFEFDNGQSTLSGIFKRPSHEGNLPAEDWVKNFLLMQGIEPSDIASSMPMDKRLALIKTVFHRCIDRLAGQAGFDGEVWAHIQQKLEADCLDSSHRFDTSSLLTLNFLNYAAKVAIVKAGHPTQNLCLFQPFQEKAMALSYKDLHADKFGEILAINWIPPIFSHGSFKDGLYYLDEHKNTINQLIHEGLLEFCAIETGAQAIGDTVAGQLAQNHLFDLLAEVGQYHQAAMNSTSAVDILNQDALLEESSSSAA